MRQALLTSGHVVTQNMASATGRDLEHVRVEPLLGVPGEEPVIIVDLGAGRPEMGHYVTAGVPGLPKQEKLS